MSVQDFLHPKQDIQRLINFRLPLMIEHLSERRTRTLPALIPVLVNAPAHSCSSCRGPFPNLLAKSFGALMNSTRIRYLVQDARFICRGICYPLPGLAVGLMFPVRLHEALLHRRLMLYHLSRKSSSGTPFLILAGNC